MKHGIAGRAKASAAVVLLGAMLSGTSAASPMAQWSDDGRRMAVYVSSWLHLFDASGTETGKLELDPYASKWLLSPDGARAAYATNTNHAWIVDLATKAKIEIFAPSAPAQECRELAWSSDSRSLAFTTLDLVKRETDVYLVQADGSNRKVLITNKIP